MTQGYVRPAAALLASLLTLPAYAQPGPTQAELSAAASNAVDWLHPNHDYEGRRFADAAEIDRDNAPFLQPVCTYRPGESAPFQTSPIVYRGVMYLTTTQSTIALDAATCLVRWRHDWIPKARANWPQNRGVALKDGKLIRGTRDGYLLALDAESGRVLWERATADAASGETFTMPPIAFGDLVIVGPAGSEVPIRGWIGAFKLHSGEPVWRFETRADRDPSGAPSWGTGDALTGGGAVWTPFSLDAVRGLVFIPVANPAPDFFSDPRPGSNLYANSLVVLDARTGKLAWHYQAIPHDVHDWDLTQASPLFTAEIGGARRPLVSVVGKEGVLRAVDRESHQPVYEVAVTRRENGDLPLTSEGVRVCPGPLGGVQWNGPAFSPKTNMLYVPAVDWCGTFKKAAELLHIPGRNYMGGTWSPDPGDRGRGWLTAIDASTGEIRWRYESRRPMLSAVAATSADLLFTGELGGDFLVFDARDGSVIFRFPTGGAMNGGIVTYQVGGKQYVAVTSGSATFFWGAPPASAAVTVFTIPPPGP